MLGEPVVHRLLHPAKFGDALKIVDKVFVHTGGEMPTS
jgi:hypothetical protein